MRLYKITMGIEGLDFIFRFSNFHPPQIAGKVSAPLAKTNEIVILSGDGSRVTGEVNRLLAELPVSVNALTGVDLSKVRVGVKSNHVISY